MTANSLVYFAYSLMTLAANDKQATEPSLKSWEPPVAQQWQYEAYPINEKLDSDEAERYHPNPRVDLDEAEQYPPPTSGEELESGDCPNIMKCIEHCKEIGFPSGLCTGSDRMTCKCYGKSRVDSDEAEQYHPNPRVDLDEAEQYPPPSSGVHLDEAEQYPPPTSGEELQSGGCPDNKECFKNCQLDGYDKGYCIGPAKENCYCSKNSPVDPTEAERSLPTRRVNSDEAEQYHPNPRVDSDEAEQYPPPTSDEILDLGGCPTFECNNGCKRNGFTYGICTGSFSQNCVCY